MLWYAGLTEKVTPEVWDLKFIWTSNVLMIAGWCFHPVGLVSLYLAFEGLLRMLAVVVTNEVVGSLPLKVLAMIVGALTRPRLPDFADTVQRTGNTYTVRCAQAKDWGGSVAISIDEALYFVGDQKRDGIAYVYTLRPVRDGEVVRGVRDYSPVA